MAKKNDDLIRLLPWGLLVAQFLWWNKKAPGVLGGGGYSGAESTEPDTAVAVASRGVTRG